MGKMFFADAMLAKLARWLRMLGFRTETVSEKLEDDAVLRLVVKQKGILLTKDARFYSKARHHVDAFLVQGNDLDSQLLQVLRHFKLDLRKIKRVPSTKICSVCNGKLRRIMKQAAKKLVPAKSWKGARFLWRCSKCRQVFWTGSHNKKIVERFGRLKAFQAKR